MQHAGEGARGAGGKRLLLARAPVAGGRANSPWNKFLIANKGLGLKREQLVRLYQTNYSKDRHELSSPRVSTVDATEASNDGAGGGGSLGRRAGGGRMESAAAANTQASGAPFLARKQRPVNQIHARTFMVVRRHCSVTDAAHSAGIAKSR